jgi:hypothetical protein
LDRRVSADAGRKGGELGSLLEAIPAPGRTLEERVAERDEARRQLACLKPDERAGLGLLAAGFSYKEMPRGGVDLHEPQRLHQRGAGGSTEEPARQIRAASRLPVVRSR